MTGTEDQKFFDKRLLGAGKHHNCDLCGENQPRFIEAAHAYVGEQQVPAVCGNCGFIYVVYRRTPEEVAAAWTALWGEDSYTSAWPAVKARLTYVAEWIDQNIGLKNKRILDIGAGEGTFMDIVTGHGGIPFGIEPSHENCIQINERHGKRCYAGTVEQNNCDDLFDIVTVNWTLENTGDCIGFLKKAREFLKPDGHLVVATGSRINVPFKKPLSMYFSDNPADTHCFRFSVNTLGRALLTAGFELVDANKYKDSDWLVMRAFGSSEKAPEDCWNDNPEKVLQFFNDWGRMWP